jgi:hypothetical protein
MLDKLSYERRKIHVNSVHLISGRPNSVSPWSNSIYYWNQNQTKKIIDRSNHLKNILSVIKLKKLIILNSIIKIPRSTPSTYKSRFPPNMSHQLSTILSSFFTARWPKNKTFVWSQRWFWSNSSSFCELSQLHND